jgi:hypothetical protein
MMYFIPWVVFLVVVILSVPVASWLEKRKLRAAYEPQDDLLDEQEEVSDLEMEEEAEPAAAVEEDGTEAADGGAFAEFEEIS